MSKTIVALFNEKLKAEKARKDMLRSGLSTNGIRVEDYDNADIPYRFDRLKSIGMPDRHAEAYCEGLRRGGGLLIANVEDDSVSEAREVLQRCGAVNVERRAEIWRVDGWKSFDINARPFTPEEAARERKEYAFRNEATATLAR